MTPDASKQPRRVPPPAASIGGRLASGCVTLVLFPWAALALLMTFATASLPLSMGFSGVVIGGGVSFTLLLPITIVLGSIVVTGLQRMFDPSVKVGISRPASFGIVGCVAGIFSLATLTSAFASLSDLMTGSPIDSGALMGGLASVFFIGVIGYFVAQHIRRARRVRRRHERPPEPPWAHPLARTEPANMIAEAAADQYNVIALVALVVSSLILANPVPALVAGGLELMYLALVPEMSWFRRRVDAKYREMAEEQARERREEQLTYLDPEQIAKHREILKLAESTKRTLEASRYPFEVSRIDRIVDHHLWLMELETYYGDHRDPERVDAVAGELDEARALLEASSGRLRQAHARRVDVLQRRLEQLSRIDEQLSRIRNQRESLEQALHLVAESALSSSGSSPADEFEEILHELAATEDVVLDFHAEEEALEDEIEAATAALARRASA